jgi:hypothetical protein
MVILVLSVKPTSTNATQALAKMEPRVLTQSTSFPVFVLLAILAFSVKPTSMNVLPILARTALLVLML